MKTKLSMNCIGLSLKDNVSKEGRHFYQMSVDQEGEAGTIAMTEECYLSIKDTFKKYSPVGLTVEYNDQYKSFRILACSPLR